MTSNDTIDQLLRKLAEAKTWPHRIQRESEHGIDIDNQIQETDKQIQALEGQAKAAMKKLGCLSPTTRTLYQAMADMLIAWQMFKDQYD